MLGKNMKALENIYKDHLHRVNGVIQQKNPGRPDVSKQMPKELQHFIQ